MSGLILAQGVDPGVGQSDRADYFAMATVALDTGTRKFHVLDMVRGRYETTHQPHLVTEEYRKWAHTPNSSFYRVGVETIFAQTDLFNHLLKDSIVPLKEVPRRSGAGSQAMNKYFRLLGLAGRYERGQVVHPGYQNAGAWLPDTGTHPWLAALEDELLALAWQEGKEMHAHDDQADAIEIAISVLVPFINSGADNTPTSTPISWFS